MRQDTIKPDLKRKVSKRLGRGNASGKGTFCGRGCKGQGQRKSGNVPSWFEGGQTPLHQKLPKLRGFNNFRRISYQAVNVKDLEKLAKDKVNREVLFTAGLIKKMDQPVKLLAYGEISQKVEVELEKASAEAIKKIEKAGGKVILPEKKENKKAKEQKSKGTEKTKEKKVETHKDASVKTEEPKKEEEKKKAPKKTEKTDQA